MTSTTTDNEVIKPSELDEIIECTRDGPAVTITAKMKLPVYKKLQWYQRGYRGKREGPAVFLCSIDKAGKINQCLLAGTSVNLDASYCEYFNYYLQNIAKLKTPEESIASGKESARL